jgi:hypothetical protein
MKIVILVLAAILFSIPAFSQVAQDKSFYEQKVIRYTRMKKTGTVLTIAGTVLTVVGFVALSNATWEEYEDVNGNIQQRATGGNALLGGVCLIAGIGSAGAGIPLAIIGSKNKKKYEDKVKSLSFRFNANPNNTGLVLTYKF